MIEQRNSAAWGSFGLCFDNLAELRGAIAPFETASFEDRAKLWNADEPIPFGLALRLVDRRLHNFVAAAQTLVDHQRRWTNKLKDEKLKLPAYAEAVAVFVGDPGRMFVQQLRNYAVHRALPLSATRLTMGVDPITMAQTITTTVRLGTADLLEWKSWRSAERKFLVDQDGEVLGVTVLLDSYEPAARRVHEALREDLDSIDRTPLP